METIKTYIENMFLNLPSTAEVQRAKRELLCMMEDKYTELKEEGKTENEAVGIVISEFGNLDEIAESLGISEVVNPQETNEDSAQTEAALAQGEKANESTEKSGMRGMPKRVLTLNLAKDYIAYKIKAARFVSLGVMLCIFSPVMSILFDAVGDSMRNDAAADIMDGIGVTLLFLMIASAVFLFVLSGNFEKGWEWVDRKRFVPDFAALAHVEEQKKEYHSQYTVYMSIGISLCIISVIPPILLDSFHAGKFLEDISGGLLLIMVGIGVFFIVLGSMVMGTYENLLRQNNRNAVSTIPADSSEIPSGEANMEQGSYFVEENKKEGPDVFWPTITCIYLCWSFLTFRWNMTWIIWPVAALINSIFKSFKK